MREWLPVLWLAIETFDVAQNGKISTKEIDKVEFKASIADSDLVSIMFIMFPVVLMASVVFLILPI